MAKKYDTKIFAGAGLLFVGDLPTILDTPVTVTVDGTQAGYDTDITVLSTVPISGIVNYSNRVGLLGVERESGEQVLCYDFDGGTPEVNLIRGLGLHPYYSEPGLSTFVKDMTDADSIDFYAYFTTPSRGSAIEVNGSIAYAEEQDSFDTMDNTSYYDKVASAPKNITATFTAPRSSLAHPNSMGVFWVNERIVYDNDTTTPYTRKLDGMSAGETITGRLVILLPKFDLGTRFTTTNTSDSKVVQLHDKAFMFWNMKFAPNKNWDYANDAQTEIETVGSGCNFTFPGVDNEPINGFPILFGRGYQDFTPDMHAILPTVPS